MTRQNTEYTEIRNPMNEIFYFFNPNGGGLQRIDANSGSGETYPVFIHSGNRENIGFNPFHDEIDIFTCENSSLSERVKDDILNGQKSLIPIRLKFNKYGFEMNEVRSNIQWH